MSNILINTTFILSSLINPLYDIYPSGENIVFEIKTEGVIVTGSYDIKTTDGVYNPIKNSNIRIGDMIVSVNGNKISSTQAFLDVFNKDMDKSSVDVEIIRNESKIKKNIPVYYINNNPKTGLYVKDRVLGIGTLTFIDTDNNIYGALGHEVIDSDTLELVEVNSGSIYLENVLNITKGSNGNPGEKVSTTKLNHNIGNIYANTEYGLFGELTKTHTTNKSYEIADPKEVKLGKAEVLTCLSGNKIEKYEIEITNLKKQDEKDLKGITFKITDERLLNISGGVFSGMSGSPIIQNGKIVGAVTHVIVSDVKSGYGVYMKYMYEEAVEEKRSM